MNFCCSQTLDLHYRLHLTVLLHPSIHLYSAKESSTRQSWPTTSSLQGSLLSCPALPCPAYGLGVQRKGREENKLTRTVFLSLPTAMTPSRQTSRRPRNPCSSCFIPKGTASTRRRRGLSRSESFLFSFFSPHLLFLFLSSFLGGKEKTIAFSVLHLCFFLLPPLSLL